MKKLIRTMMNLIGNEICGEKIDAALFADFTETDAVRLYRLSNYHDLAHVVGDALIKNNLINEGEAKERFGKEVFKAVYRYEKMRFEHGEIRRVLEENKIPFVPLKGAVLRSYYPEEWMRTSCDIDVLVKEEDLERAITAITDALGYSLGDKNYHDVSLMSGNGVHLELHFSIKEHIDKLDAVLCRAWEYASPVKDGGYEHAFTKEFFIFHQYAHAAYHFLSGGCGVKPVLDIFVMKNDPRDEEKLNAMLSEAGIAVFADKLNALASAWFGGGEYESVTEEMEKYVISGGVYGNAVNHTAASRAKKKSKAGHIASRIWLPYRDLVIQYPSLKGKRILQPFYEIRRWFRLFKRSTLKRSVNELKINREMSEDKVSAAGDMLKELGLL